MLFQSAVVLSIPMVSSAPRSWPHATCPSAVGVRLPQSPTRSALLLRAPPAPPKLQSLGHQPKKLIVKVATPKRVQRRGSTLPYYR